MPGLQNLPTWVRWPLLIALSYGTPVQTPVHIIATVSEVADGDTFKVRIQGLEEDVRVFGVDAPEGPQAFGQDAKRFAEVWLLGKTVALKPKGRDRNGRLVAAVRVEDKDFGQELVGAGYAWHYIAFAPREKELAAREHQARARRKGLWRQRAPQPPWEFRNGVPPSHGQTVVAFHGNRNSRVFHAPGCRDYDCKNCLVSLKTIDDARSQGFRPHAVCVR